VRPDPRHELVVVSDWDENPTYCQDKVNAQLPEELQYPTKVFSAPEVTIDSDETELSLNDQDYSELALGHPTLLRCSREKHPELRDAQRFFGNLRRDQRWRLERPIYRTGRFWVKPIYT
jgi:hypothetical protein